MKKFKTTILLIGGGGHCRAAIDVIEATQAYEVVGIVEADGVEPDQTLPYPVVGFDSDLPALLKQTPNCLITIGQTSTAELRIKLYHKLKKLGAQFPVIVSPHAYLSPNAQIGEGTIVMHQALVNTHAKVGVNCLINSQALIEHEAEVDGHCHISTGAKLNGAVKVGKGCLIGSGSVIKQCIEIADNTVIGAGSVVVKPVSQPGVYSGLIKGS